MVLAVQDRVRTWDQKRRSLHDEGEEIEKAFPKSIHREHAMRTVSMVEERLGKDRQSPVRAEQDEYRDHFTSLLIGLDHLPYHAIIR